MRFAIIDHNRVEASPKLKDAKGVCQICSEPVIAKTGTQKIWHWAHRSKINCDKWREPETEWHRAWKNNYTADWQEIPLIDEGTGEKHIADVRTAHHLVIEFQHSHIEPQEKTKREMFYKNMVWVVDGTRLKRDYIRFFNEKKSNFSKTFCYRTDKPGILRLVYLQHCFPSAWLKRPVPVVFDFGGDGTSDDPEGIRNVLYCLFPQVGRFARVAEISRDAFIKETTNGRWATRVRYFIDDFIRQDE